MRVLLVDNYDSYTYNLCQQIARIGSLEPVVIRNDEVEASSLAAFIDAHGIEAVVISPGPGRPERSRDFGVCGALITELELPLLGVCLGHQGIAWCHGGAIARAPEPVHGRLSPVWHDGEGVLAGIPQGFEVVRYHSLAVSGVLPPSLRRTAWTRDGVLMGLRHARRPLWGVQFHPESVATQHGDRIIENFLDLAERWRRHTGLHSESPRPRGPRVRSEARAPEPAPAEIRALETWIDPEQVFVALYADARRCYWLDSASTAGSFARFSYMGAAQLEGDRTIRYDRGRGELRVEAGGHVERVRQGLLDWLELELGLVDARPGSTPELPFTGGYVGYLGYELAAECEASVADHASAQADAVLLDCQRFVAFDHDRRRVLLVSREADAEARAAWFTATAAALACIEPAPPPSRGASPSPDPLPFRLARDRARYLADVAACQLSIAEGESYELCLTNQLIGPPISAPLDAYRILRARNPAPMAAYLRVDELAVLSCSPELFLRLDRGGAVVTRPIKGTAARGPTPASDEAARARLACSEKDRAENLMIVDLMRNDLGRVCEVGSVEVSGLMEIESFASVHQLVSTVRGQLAPDRGAVDLLRATFPGGSMTGAPKLRTMEILHGLEQAPRGIYSGCIGYLGDRSSGAAAQLSIVIRTAVCTPDETRVGVGGAVITQSDPEAELAEILLKAEAVLAGLAEAEIGAPLTRVD